MNKKIFPLLVVLLITGQLFAAQVPCLITVSADRSETAYALTGVQRIVFANSAMTVIMKSAPDVTGIVSARFETTDPTGTDPTSIADAKAVSSVFIFPNPVKSVLTLNNVETNSKVDLYSVTGALLQSVFTQDSSTDIDVSSLQQGTYLLRIGKQTLKFVKQ